MLSRCERTPDLLETLEILTQLGVQRAGGQLCEAPVPEVLLPAVNRAPGEVSKVRCSCSQVGVRERGGGGDD